MRKTKFLRPFISLITILGLCVLGACTGEESGRSEKSNNELEIGVSLGTLNNPFFVSMSKAAKNYAKEHNAKVYVESADYDLAKQTQQIEDFITKNVDLIILNAADTSGIAGAVQQAKDAGIPVVAVDVKAEGGVNATITSDNYQAGKLAGEYMVKRLNGSGNVAIVTGPPTSSFIDRVAGFKDAIKDSDLKVIAEQNGGGTRGPAQKKAETILQAHPEGEIDAIFGANDPTALGVYTASKQADRDGYFIVGVDGSPDFIKAMKEAKGDGMLAGTSAQFPSEMIKQAMKTGMKIIDGKDVKETTKVPVKLITSENIADYQGWVK